MQQSKVSVKYSAENSVYVRVACVASVSNRVIARKVERKQKIFLLLLQLSRRTSRGNACYAGYVRVSYHLLYIGVFVGGSGVGWALILGWALINSFCFRMGAYSRWALIRG